MKTVYYDFLDNYYMQQEYRDSPQEGLSLFVEKNWIKTSCPFSKLKSFAQGMVFKNIFELYSSMQKDYLDGRITKNEYDIYSKSSFVTARSCPALNSMVKNSLMVKCPVDVVISWEGQNIVTKIAGRGPEEDSTLLIISNDHPSAQSTTEDGYKIYGETTSLKFKIPLRFTTPVPMIFLQPSLHGPVPWTVVNGVIDPGRSFNVSVIVTVPSNEKEVGTIHIKQGTVIAYLWSPEKYNLKYRTTKMGRFRLGKLRGN